MFQTPILFLIFNRPTLTSQVFAKIREIKPQYLYIAADGPRVDNSNDLEKCETTRNVVLHNIDWDCEVKYLFRDTNLGCGLAPCQAITWFFEHVTQGIILEDDCLPDLSFFTFCEEMLERYKYDTSVFQINGSCINSKEILNNYTSSYFYSAYPQIWGWATWRRAWNHYQYEIENKDISFINSTFSKKEINYWQNLFIKFKNVSIDVWDLQWTFAFWNNQAKAITPTKNLITNIGFGADATHTKLPNDFLIRESEQHLHPYSAPYSVQINVEFDKNLYKNIFSKWAEKSFFQKIYAQVNYYYVKYKKKIISQI